MTATVPRADRHRGLPGGNLNVCLIGTARKGGLMLAEANVGSVFIFLKAVKKLQ